MHPRDRNTHLFCGTFQEVGQELLLRDGVVHFHSLLGNLRTEVVLQGLKRGAKVTTGVSTTSKEKL